MSATGTGVAGDVDGFYAGHPLARAVHDRVASTIASIGPAEMRVSKSQVAFRRGRGFAYLSLIHI